MKFTLSAFSHLPLPLKIASSVLGGGSLLGLVYVLFPGHFWVIFVGLIFVGIFLGLYAYLLKRQKLRKAAPMEQGLMSNTAATPHGISEAASVARLDDLRKKFEEGLEKFRSAGKNIYSLPWYALVGEPGSGKTEAIRHCNVGFPPGLQDQLQGSGGTLNMNWWFTNHAIIIDTAGRLMFEEVQPGTGGEWEEFLKLLKSNRPDCPINGLLLTISAESLIKDTADDLERKGGKIAQQLDNIQRMLGVRFPVFVMITKCDLVNGFREFFDDLTDPDLQHQILGWSNPAQLDEPFNPTEVDQHLEKVREYLQRRRMRLLLDPIHTENPDERRADQVDALFAFPEALARLSPRLRRYLEMIFVAGEWSSKPLFLRGIYFTSAMREGSALDADLAEVLGVPVDSLPEGKVWETERAYFLRDLFKKKVFAEKGLVTRATNTKQLQRQRKGVVLGAGLGFLALFFLLTGFGASQLKKSIGSQLDAWKAIEHQFVTPSGNSMKIVDQAFPGAPYEYSGATKLNLKDQSTTLGQFPVTCRVLVQKTISTPLVFQPLRWLNIIGGEGFNASRRNSMRVLFETGYLLPLFEATQAKMLSATPEDWSPDASNALAQLGRVFVISHSTPTLMGGGLSGDDPDEIRLDGFARYVLAGPKSEEEYEKYKADDQSLQEEMHWIYSGSGGDQAWPPKIFAHNPEATLDALAMGVDAFSDNWSRRIKSGAQDDQGYLLAHLVNLKNALGTFRKGEKLIQRMGEDLESDVDTLGVAILAQEWRTTVDSIVAAKRQIDAEVQVLGDQIDEPIDVLCKQARDQILSEGAMPEYEKILEAISLDGRKDMSDESRTRLAQVRSKLEGNKETLKRTARNLADELEEELPRLARLLLAKTPKGDVRMYEINFDMYQHADNVYSRGIEAVRELIEKYKAFPLCLTGDLRQEMSVERAAKAFRLLDQSRGADEAGPANLAVAALKRGGGVAFYKQVKEKMETILKTSRTLVVGDYPQWYQKLEGIRDALQDKPPLTCELVVLPFTQQKERPKIPGVDLSDTPLTPHRYFEVHWGDEPIGQRMQTDRGAGSDPPKFKIPGKKISFKFYHHHDSEQPDALAEADAPWTILKTLHTHDARPDKDDKQIWKLALILKDLQGVRYYYWVGLKFNRPVPDLDQWPSEETWPEVEDGSS